MRGVLERIRRLEEIDRRAWRNLIFALAGVAFFLRVLLELRHAPGNGGYDFRWYRQVGYAALHGNPYTAHLIPPTDVPPLQALTFAALRGAGGAPLRTLFMLGDVGIILLVGLALRQSRIWRLNLACWIAINPMLVLVWDVTVEDKNLYILCMVAAVAAVQAARPFLALAAAGIFALFKYVGGFLLPPIALMILRTHGWRRMAASVAGFGALFAASQLPWFPDSLDAFTRRQARASPPHPFHTTWTILLDKVHLYDPAIVSAILVGGVLVAYGSLLTGRLSTVEAMGLALIATFFALPDSDPGRIMMMTVLFILITPLTGGGWLVLWTMSTIAAVANGVLDGIPVLSASKGTITSFVGGYGGVRSVILTNLPLFAAAALYAMSHMSHAPLRLLVHRRVRAAVSVT